MVNNFDRVMREATERLRANMQAIFMGGNLNKLQNEYIDLKKIQLRQFTTKELMAELRSRGKTVGKKSFK